jgi:hypothetical protein
MGNVRTVKAFADEESSIAKFVQSNADIYKIALYKGNLWGAFMGGIVTFTGLAICGQIAIITTQVDPNSSL